MANQVSAWVKLKEVVSLYLESARLPYDANFLRCWRIAFRGFSHFGISSVWQPKTVSLSVNANKTVTFPSDYIQWIRVGQQDGNRITTLKNNQSLFSGSSPYAGAADVVGGDVWFNGFVPVGISQNTGSIDFAVTDTHLILNTNYIGSSILLEYLSSPERDTDYTIPIQFQEATIAWLAWQDNKNTPSTSHINRGDKRDAQDNFRAQVKLARKMWKPFRLSDVQGGVADFNISDTISATTFTVEWDWSTNTSDIFTQTLSNTLSLTTGDDISITVGAPPTANSFLLVRYPSTEAAKTAWFNTALNNGTIPDQAFQAVQTSGALQIIASRAGASFDNLTPTVFS